MSQVQTPAIATSRHAAPFPVALGGLSPGAVDTPGRSGRSLLRASARTAIACVLIGAAILKGREAIVRPDAVLEGLPQWVALLAVEAELVLGLALLANLWPRLSCRFGSALFVAFACLAVWKGLAGDRSCGCFGAVRVSPWLTALFDLSAAPLLWWCGGVPGAGAGRHRWHVAAAATVALLAGVAGATLVAMRPVVHVEASLADADVPLPQSGGTLILDPESWVGKRFPLREQLAVAADVSRGQWQVLLYHHDCANCRELLANLSQARKARMVLVSVPPHAERDDPAAGLGIPVARLDADRTWFARTPLSILVAEGRVVSITGPDELKAAAGKEQP